MSCRDASLPKGVSLQDLLPDEGSGFSKQLDTHGPLLLKRKAHWTDTLLFNHLKQPFRKGRPSTALYKKNQLKGGWALSSGR